MNFGIGVLARLRTGGVTCAGAIALLAMSGCSGSDIEQDATASPETVTPSATPSPNDVEPTTPVAPSLAAGIPTVEPSPAATSNSANFDASATITLATVDPDTGGLLIGGYVSGVAEDGGDCQYVIAPSAGETFTVDRGGVENNGSTSCGSVTVDKARAPAGSYTVQLMYVNDHGELSSEAVKVEIP